MGTEKVLFLFIALSMGHLKAKNTPQIGTGRPNDPELPACRCVLDPEVVRQQTQRVSQSRHFLGAFGLRRTHQVDVNYRDPVLPHIEMLLDGGFPSIS
jgi:hypothetical protein